MKVIYFDVSALLIMVILLAVVFFKHMVRGDINKYFLLLLCASILSAAADIWAVLLDNGTLVGGPVSKYLSHTAYLMLHNCMTPFFIMYCMALTDSWFVGKFKYFKKILLWTPLIAIFFLLIANLNNKQVFYIDELGQYVRGPWFPLLYVSAAIYVVLGIIQVIRCWHVFDIGRWLALLSGIAFMLTATAIQFFIPEMLVEMIAGALALFFILLMVQKPEEMLDVETGLLSRQAGLTMLKHCERRNRKKHLILLSVTNYKQLHNRLSYEQEKTMYRGLAQMMLDYIDSYHERAEVYHMLHGRAMVVMREEVDKAVVNIMARTLLAMHRQSMSVGNYEVELRPNACVCEYMDDIDDADTLMHFFEDISRREPSEDILFAKNVFVQSRYDILSEIDEILDRAIRERKFMVYYQPIFSVEEEKYRSAEALIRLKDEKYGFIPPDLFIPAAEKSGAIRQIGKIVLEEVCRFIGSEEYRELGLHYIEVNLSVVQCMEQTLVDDVLGTFDRFHIEARDVNLEITETAVSDEQQVMDYNINRLFDEGVCFSLDDFGTGYSNIQRIASLPLSIIKIDKSLVDNSGQISMQIVIENTVKMIKALGMKIVVEGVETEQQLRQFVALHCEYIQGYYFSKPLPREEFVAFLKTRGN